MRIGISASIVGWEEKQLIKSINESNHECVFLDDGKLFYEVSNQGNDNLDVVLVRNQSFVRGICIARYYANKEIISLNTSRQIELCSNKYFLTLHLKKEGISVPRTALAFTAESGLNACDAIGYPVVIKPLYGGHGNLVSLAHTKEAAAGIIETREILGQNFQKAFIIQDYLPLERDIRILIVGNKAICGISRCNKKDWRHNTSKGAQAMPFIINNDIQTLVNNITKTIGHGIFGLDLFETKDGYLVNEINHVCQFKNPSNINNLNVAKIIIEHAIRVKNEN